jgi:large subunit ribosomal protein L21
VFQYVAYKNTQQAMQRLCAQTLRVASKCRTPRCIPVTAISAARAFTFAGVDHSAAYNHSMAGRHGKQLELAEVYGIGKDDPDYDPFIEEEREEDRIRALRAARGDDSDDEADEVIPEGEIVGEDKITEGGPEDAVYDPDYEEEEELLKGLYNNDGSIRRKKSQVAMLRAGAPAGGLFAVIQLAGSQHKVTTDDVLIVNRLKPVQTYAVGTTHILKDILLVGSTHVTLVGMPFVDGAEVELMIEEVTKGPKVIIFKNRRRQNSQRKKGFRRDVTMLRVLDIRPPSEYANHEHLKRQFMPEGAEEQDGQNVEQVAAV